MLIAVELDAPAANLRGDARSTYVESALRLRDAGVGLLTMADNPCAVPRGDSVCLAAFFGLETGMPILPHIACRDKNILSLKSALLALDIAGVHEVLIVTGDPFRREDRESGAIRSFGTALDFARRVAKWNGDSFSAPFALSAALNVNAKNFDAELRKAKRKEDAGVSRFFTQPVLSSAALENLSRSRSELSARIIGGVLPVVSRGNADYLARGEIPGIALDFDVHRRYRDCDKAEGAELAVALSLEFGASMRAFVDGYCIITPFKRIDIVERVALGLATIAADRESAQSPDPRAALAV